MANTTCRKSAKVTKKAAAKPAKPAKRASRVVNEKPASLLIDQRIRDLGGWRGETLAQAAAIPGWGKA